MNKVLGRAPSTEIDVCDVHFLKNDSFIFTVYLPAPVLLVE